jgi:ribosomal protein S18 acetylase RimI-like enzyme
MIRFRTATATDVPALRALIERAYRGETAKRGWTHEADLLDGDRTSDTELAEAIADEKARVLLARIDGKVAGTVTIRDLGEGRAYLGMLCVDPDLQTEGLGRALIADAEDMAAEEFGANIMSMTVIDARAELIAYYERRGYTRTGELRPFPLPMDVPYQMVVLERPIG